MRLCPYCHNPLSDADVNQLRTENDKRIYDRCIIRVGQLEAENAKLRELVRDMFRDFANADNELKRDQGRTFMAVTRYAPRMRELEVDDG